ncbi:MAG: YciI family protein [Ignavibacteriaceae bacterium]|jgi:uncharacterized protein YciI
MLKQFVFFYLMKNNLERIRNIVPEHIRYWKESKPINYSGGPFNDRSGGLILFEAENMETATKFAMNDPFVVQCLIESKWVKEWIRE